MKIVVHPLFFVFGLYFALTGKVFLFLTFALTALLHEYGHAFAAERLGYMMNNISLMPYGAVVNGAIDGLSYKDEVAVALAGPFTNLALCAVIAAVWWLIPESYPWTETIALSNLSVAAVNLLPAYPLDGGRICSASLSQIMSPKKAVALVRIVGVIIGIALIALFVYSLFSTPNFSIMFFALFIIVGALGRSKESAYVRMFKGLPYFSGSVRECKRLVVSSSLTLRKLIARTEGDCFYSFDVTYGKSGKAVTLSIAQAEELLASYRYDETIGNILEEKRKK